MPWSPSRLPLWARLARPRAIARKGPPRRPADAEEYLGEKMLEGDGTRRCLNCHTTNFYSILQGVGPEAADHSIGCERCHGPGGHHVAAAAAGFSDLAIVSPGEASPAANNQDCGQCHGILHTAFITGPRAARSWFCRQSVTMALSC